MSTEQKKAKILAAAATHGWTPEVYGTEIAELKAAGMIEAREVFTTGGNRKHRYFLKAAA